MKFLRLAREHWWATVVVLLLLGALVLALTDLSPLRNLSYAVL